MTRVQLKAKEKKELNDEWNNKTYKIQIMLIDKYI